MAFKHYGDRIELDGTQNLRLKNGSQLVRQQDELFDHFNSGAGAINSSVPQYWVTTDTGTGTQFVSGTGAGSYAVGATAGTTNNAEEIGGKKIGWNCSTRGPMTLEVRAKFVGSTTATDGDFGIGFADANTYTSGLAYVVSAASALTTTAPTEFAGFWYSSIPTSGSLYSASGNLVGMITSKNGVDTVTASSPAQVKDSSFHIYRIEVDTSANTRFYVDDVWVGTVAAAFTANTEMTPYIGVIAKNSHVHTASIDYIRVSAKYL